DKEQRDLGLSPEEASAIIQDIVNGGDSKHRYDYAVFFLSLYNDGSADLAPLRPDLEAERARLQIPEQEAKELEKAVIDYFDYYHALVTGTEVEEWARAELKAKQEELKLTDDIVS